MREREIQLFHLVEHPLSHSISYMTEKREKIETHEKLIILFFHSLKICSDAISLENAKEFLTFYFIAHLHGDIHSSALALQQFRRGNVDFFTPLVLFHTTSKASERKVSGKKLKIFCSIRETCC